jgi:hypothetical protein
MRVLLSRALLALALACGSAAALATGGNVGGSDVEMKPGETRNF